MIASEVYISIGTDQETLEASSRRVFQVLEIRDSLPEEALFLMFTKGGEIPSHREGL